MAPASWAPRFDSVTLKVIRSLGRGAFAEVVLVEATCASGADVADSTERRQGHFALKRANVASLSEEGSEKALAEAELLKRLSAAQDSVLRCFDFRLVQGTSPVLELLLEVATLGDLNTRIRSLKESGAGEGLPEQEAVAYGRDVAAALSHIHGERPKIFHRDVKPANVVLFIADQPDGIPKAKLADFGIAKILEHEGTRAGAVTLIGTPHYFSPEICRGEQYDERADAWALGCVLYEMMCLRRPFHQAEHNIAVLAIRISEGRYDRAMLAEKARYYNGLLILTLTNLLCPDPEQRFRASDALEALERLRALDQSGSATHGTSAPDAWWRRHASLAASGGGGASHAETDGDCQGTQGASHDCADKGVGDTCSSEDSWRHINIVNQWSEGSLNSAFDALQAGLRATPTAAGRPKSVEAGKSLTEEAAEATLAPTPEADPATLLPEETGANEATAAGAEDVPKATATHGAEVWVNEATLEPPKASSSAGTAVEASGSLGERISASQSGNGISRTTQARLQTPDAPPTMVLQEDFIGSSAEHGAGGMASRLAWGAAASEAGCYQPTPTSVGSATPAAAAPAGAPAGSAQPTPVAGGARAARGGARSPTRVFMRPLWRGGRERLSTPMGLQEPETVVFCFSPSARYRQRHLLATPSDPSGGAKAGSTSRPGTSQRCPATPSSAAAVNADNVEEKQSTSEAQEDSTNTERQAAQGRPEDCAQQQFSDEAGRCWDAGDGWLQVDLPCNPFDEDAGIFSLTSLEMG